MNTLALTTLNNRSRVLLPGFIVSVIVAAAATFLSEHYGAPVIDRKSTRLNSSH